MMEVIVEQLAEFAINAYKWGCAILLSWLPLWFGWNWGVHALVQSSSELGFFSSLFLSVFFNTLVHIAKGMRSEAK